MSPDDKKPATPAATGFATAPASSPAQVQPDDENYPPYVIEFSGGQIESGGQSVTLVKVTGPHTFSLLQPGNGSLKVSLTRSESDGIRPNLSIKFT